MRRTPNGSAARQQLETSLIGAVTAIRDRRFVAIDPLSGAGVARLRLFDHRSIDWTWELGEMFKIEGEKSAASRR